MDDTVKELIDDWHSRIDTNQRAHYYMAERYNKFHYWIGLPATILSAIAGATLLTQIDNATVKTIVGLVGLLAAILVGVQTFYSFAKRSEIHRATATQLGELRREIEILECLPPDDKQTQSEMIKQINTHLAKIEESALVIDSNLLRKINNDSASDNGVLTVQ